MQNKVLYNRTQGKVYVWDMASNQGRVFDYWGDEMDEVCRLTDFTSKVEMGALSVIHSTKGVLDIYIDGWRSFYTGTVAEVFKGFRGGVLNAKFIYPKDSEVSKGLLVLDEGITKEVVTKVLGESKILWVRA